MHIFIILIFDINQEDGEERGSFIIPTFGVSVEF